MVCMPFDMRRERPLEPTHRLAAAQHSTKQQRHTWQMIPAYLVDLGCGCQGWQRYSNGHILQVEVCGRLILYVDIGLPTGRGRPAVDQQRHHALICCLQASKTHETHRKGGQVHATLHIVKLAVLLTACSCQAKLEQRASLTRHLPSRQVTICTH